MRFTYQSGAQPLTGYTIQRGIHRGGFGEVYFAQSDGGKEVALKLLNSQDHDVEVRGVTQCLNLKHPNLVNLFDVKTDEHGDHWVVMEYVSGSSLEDVLASFPDGLPMNEIRDWLIGLVAGVTHLHERGIVHRDMKPANVYRENGVVKIGDVGLSKRLDSDGRRQHTQSVGTVYYMAPEVAKGQYGPEVDVYSLGVMLYELITGKLPFTGETTAEILMKHLTTQPDLAPIPKSLRPTIARALEKDPRRRTPTVRQLEQDFLRALDPRVAETIPESAFASWPTSKNGHSKDTFARAAEQTYRPTGRNGQIPQQKAAVTGNSLNGPPNRFWTNTLIILAVLVIFVPNTHFAVKIWSPMILVAFGIVVFHAIREWALSSRGLLSPYVWPSPRPFTRPQQAAAQPFPRMPTVVPAHRATTSMPDAEANQAVHRSFIQQLSEVGKSLSFAGFTATLLSMAVYLSLDTFDRAALMPSIEHAALFSLVSALAVWLVLFGSAWTTRPGWTKRGRWHVRLATGAIIGTSAYFLDQFLLVIVPRSAYVTRPIFWSLGVHPLTEASVDPTWLGYVVFFVCCLGLRRWSRDADPRRKQRFSPWSTAGAIGAAYLISFVLAFPQWYAMLWAGTISASLQLASTWSPRPQVARRS